MSGIKRILGWGAALALGVTSAWAAEMFSDVPRGHWAYDAISRAVEAGVLEGVDGKFMGNKLITRHQMAVIVAKLLDRIEKGGSAVASKLQPRDVANLEALTIEFADELALMNVKLSTLEDAFVELKNSVEALKAGRAVEDHPHRAGAQFSGLLAVGVVAADDGLGGPAVAGAGPAFRTRYTPPTDTAFTVPQASLGLDLDVGQGVGVHTQFDYTTDGASGPGPAVALNQAYLTWDNGPGPFGFKAGLMALPFQSWEYNGPQRTLMNSITPSTLNRFWELHRVVGVEAQKSVNQTADSMKWRLGVFTGNDLSGAIGGGPFVGRVYGGLLGLSSDAPVSGSGTPTFDGALGFYLDLESGTTGRFGWRLGYFDVGGDNTASAPNVSSNDWSGFHIGGWYRGNRWQAQAQGLFGDEDYGSGAANTDDLAAYHLSLRYDVAEGRNIFLRYDDWESDNQAAGTGSGTGDLGGTVITLAYNHKVTDTSMFQFEYLNPDEDVATGSTDINDTLIQARYKVWW